MLVSSRQISLRNVRVAMCCIRGFVEMSTSVLVAIRMRKDLTTFVYSGRQTLLASTFYPDAPIRHAATSTMQFLVCNPDTFAPSLKVPQRAEGMQTSYTLEVSPVHINFLSVGKNGSRKIDIPARHPCIISSFPCILLVIKMTSAPNLVHVSCSNSIVFGRPPRFFESHRIMR
jgi:hypothetical protein